MVVMRSLVGTLVALHVGVESNRVEAIGGLATDEDGVSDVGRIGAHGLHHGGAHEEDKKLDEGRGKRVVGV